MNTPQHTTCLLNSSTLANVQKGIAARKSSEPYMATSAAIMNVITDQDHFPYTRYYRGQPGATCPVVAERETGWRRQQDQCYNVNLPANAYPDSYPRHCFQGPCSFVHPCYPELMKENPDPSLLATLLNRACVQEYR